MAARGKIGRLPAQVRLRINEMMRDGRPYEEVIAFAAKNGEATLTPQNVSSWKEHGHQEWLRRQERIEESRSRVEFAQEYVAKAKEAGDESLAMAGDAASMLAVDSILEVLEKFDATQLSALLAEKPGKFVDLVFALQQVRGKDQSAMKLRMQLEDYRRKIKAMIEEAKALAGESGAASKDDIDRIFKEAYGV